MVGLGSNNKKFSSSMGDLDVSNNTISGMALLNPLIGTLGRIERKNSNGDDDIDNSMNNHSTLTI